jgi:hypothetical protein
MKDNLQFFTVKVADGSGCLFQPIDTEYSYVLTARHVIEGVDNIRIVRQYIKDGLLENEDLEILVQPFLHPDLNKDAAIIKVKKVDDIDVLLRADFNDFNSIEKENWYLCGYPQTRTNDDFSFRKNKLKIENPVNLYIEGEIEKAVVYSEIVGQSGGGIIKSENSCFLLVGIQIKMAFKDDVESLSRIHFAPLSFFDEIVEENNNVLSQLFPPYFASLEIILEDIFPLKGLQLNSDKEKMLKRQLRVIAKNLCSIFSANAILDFYQKSMLSDGMNESYITHRQLWIAFLELLSINQLHIADKDLTLDDFVELRKKHSLVFLDCDDWVKKLDIIAKSDLTMLEKGGAVIVGSTKDISPNTVELDIDYINDICTVPTEEMTISSSVSSIAEDLRILHIYKFQKHIIDNYKLFKNINQSTVKQTIIDETRNII